MGSVQSGNGAAFSIKPMKGKKLDPERFHKAIYQMALLLHVDRDITRERLQALYDFLAVKDWDDDDVAIVCRHLCAEWQASRFPPPVEFLMRHPSAIDKRAPFAVASR